MEKVIKSENIDLAQLFEKLQKETLFFVPKLIYYSISFNCDIKNEKVDFTLNDVFDWIDEVGINNDEVVKFINTFTNVTQVHFPQDEGKTQPQKKVAKK